MITRSQPMSPVTPPVALLAVALFLFPATLPAASIVFTDASQGNPLEATFAPLLPVSAGTCGVDSGIGDACQNVYFLADPFGGQTAQIQLVDGATGDTSLYSTTYSSTSNAIDDLYSDPNNPGHVGVEMSLQFSGVVGSNDYLTTSFFDYQGYPYVDGFGCAGCVGPVTGALQLAFTVNYLDSGSNVLGSDQVYFEGQGSYTPEPASFALAVTGLALALAVSRATRAAAARLK